MNPINHLLILIRQVDMVKRTSHAFGFLPICEYAKTKTDPILTHIITKGQGEEVKNMADHYSPHCDRLSFISEYDILLKCARWKSARVDRWITFSIPRKTMNNRVKKPLSDKGKTQNGNCKKTISEGYKKGLSWK